MPSIDQCDPSDPGGDPAALSSTLEMFDKFKSNNKNEESSDSEESFHLPLDDDEIESQSVVLNGKDKETHKEETEDDILNKIETEADITDDHLDSHAEDSILNDDDENEQQNTKEETAKTEIKITYKFADNYENNEDGEFKSLYEEDTDLATATKQETEPMEVSEEISTPSLEFNPEITKNDLEIAEITKNDLEIAEITKNDLETVDHKLDNEDAPMEDIEASTSMAVDVEMSNVQENLQKENKKPTTFFQDATEKSKDQKACAGEAEVSIPIEDFNNQKIDQETSVECIKKSTQENIEESLQETARPKEGLQETAEEVTSKVHKDPKTNDDAIFKVPSTEIPVRESPDHLTNEKSIDDETDLLDISMIRETEEDDACAIADAIEMKETQGSDEEQSEKTETEQENSDGAQDDDNTMGFEDLDDASGMDCDESLNNAETETTKVLEEEIVSNENSDDDSSSNKIMEMEPEVEEEQEPANGATVQEPSEEIAVINNKENESIVVENNTSELNDKTEKNSDQDKEVNKNEDKIVQEDEINNASDETRKSLQSKRTLSADESDEAGLTAKKPKLATKSLQDDMHRTELPQTQATATFPSSVDSAPNEKNDTETVATEKIQTLTSFSKFMQCRKLSTKLTRSDLEQFCIQKICESLMLKSSDGELHQTIKKHEKLIETLRKDLQQLTKQCRDLEVVNKRLMNELKTQNETGNKKPIVPLKITRSVGLQVRMNPGNETHQNRRRQQMSITPQRAVQNSPAKKGGPQTNVIRQVLNSPQKSPLTTTTSTVTNAPMLTQALQQQKRSSSVVAKRTTTPVRKPAEAAVKPPANPGVIDLTDEDDRSKTIGNGVKFKTVTGPSRVVINNNNNNKQSPSGGKPVLNQSKAVGKQVANKSNTISSAGIRLTPTSVINSSANNSTQMLYVVPTITSNAGGQQKVAFVNFQSTNGVISGTLNGSPVSVMNKPGQTLTLKSVSNTLNRHKHPAPLPTPPRANVDSKLKPTLPKPHLTIKKLDNGIILQWKMPYNLDLYENIASYQLYAYQETSAPPNTDMWRKVGDVKALALPMACTLTQFADKNKYYFAVRSVDVFKRIGAFSDPEEISL